VTGFSGSSSLSKLRYLGSVSAQAMAAISASVRSPARKNLATAVDDPGPLRQGL